MKVVFYIEIGGGGSADSDITHVGSYGERTHALSLARLFRDAGHDPIFVVGPCIERHISSAGFEAKVFASPSEGIQLVRQIDPQLVIGCELFNLSPASAKGLIEFGRPLATVDGTTIPLVINSDPFGIPALQRDLVLPSKYFSFRPCPVNDIKPNTDDAFYWPLFPRKIRRPEKRRRHIRRTRIEPIAQNRPVCRSTLGPGSVHAVQLQELLSKPDSKNRNRP